MEKTSIDQIRAYEEKIANIKKSNKNNFITF